MRYIKEVGIYSAMTGRSAQAIQTDRGIAERLKNHGYTGTWNIKQYYNAGKC